MCNVVIDYTIHLLLDTDEVTESVRRVFDGSVRCVSESDPDPSRYLVHSFQPELALIKRLKPAPPTNALSAAVFKLAEINFHAPYKYVMMVPLIRTPFRDVTYQ